MNCAYCGRDIKAHEISYYAPYKERMYVCIYCIKYMTKEKLEKLEKEFAQKCLEIKSS